MIHTTNCSKMNPFDLYRIYKEREFKKADEKEAEIKENAENAVRRRKIARKINEEDFLAYTADPVKHHEQWIKRFIKTNKCSQCPSHKTCDSKEHCEEKRLRRLNDCYNEIYGIDHLGNDCH